jgi:hypothetical protein
MDARATTIIQDSLQTICKHNEKSQVANIFDVHTQREIIIEETSGLSDSNELYREAPRVTELTEQFDSEDGNHEQLEKDLELIGKTLFFTKKNYHNHRQIIDRVLERIRQLVKKVQAQKDLKYAQQVSRLKRALKKKKVRDRKKRIRFIEKINILTKEKEVYRKKAIRQYKIRKKLKLLLIKERNSVKHFEDLLNQAKKERDITNSKLSDMKRTQQELLTQLQREIELGQEDRRKAKKSETELEVVKQQYSSTKLQMENEIINLYAQIEYQIENSDSINKLLLDENKELVSKIEYSQNIIKLRESLILKLKNKSKALLRERSDLKRKISKLEKYSRVREKNLKKSIDSKSDEIDLLKKKSCELHIVQSELELQKSIDSDKEVLELQEKLKRMQLKLVRADEKIELYDRLKRERDVQEAAIEMLSDDFDAIVEEKEVLTQERENLRKEISFLKEQCSDFIDDCSTSYKEAGLSLKMLKL